jgi:hypothetical protein
MKPILAALEEKNARHSRARAGGHDPRCRVPRKQTRFPGQFGTCWYCGSHFVWGGNGLKDHLMCARSRKGKCWNSVSFDGPLLVRRLMTALFDRLTILEGFNEQFRALIRANERARSVESALKRLRHEEERLVREQKNILDGIAKYGPQAMFDERMASIARQASALKAERYQLEGLVHRRLTIPESPQALRALMEKSFQHVSETSPEFGFLMREIVPEFHVFLVRLCDGGHPLPRIQARLDLSGICPDARLVDGLQPLLSSTIMLDIFEPSQRERIRDQAVQLIREGCQQREACRRIEEQPTQPALQRALRLHQMMQELRIDTPYVLLRSPPDDYPKLRRYKAGHFWFEPIEGYVPPELF